MSGGKWLSLSSKTKRVISVESKEKLTKILESVVICHDFLVVKSNIGRDLAVVVMGSGKVAVGGGG